MVGVRGWEMVRRLLGHEGRWLVSLVWWVRRRPIGVAEGDRPLGYAAAQAALVYGLTFICVVESAVVGLLLTDHPTAHAVMLVVDGYAALAMLGVQASAVTRPHVVAADGLRLRAGGRMDVRVPLDRIASVRYDLRFGAAAKAPSTTCGELLELAVGGQTSVIVELAEPVVAVRLLGQRMVVRTVRFHADDARGAVTAIRAAVAAARQSRQASEG